MKTHTQTSAELSTSPLGKKSAYITQYNPDLLFPIPREMARKPLGIQSVSPLPFAGVDIWNAYELSWLNLKGKPMVARGEFVFPCSSPFLIESKSFKLYLNSFNNTCFESEEAVLKVLKKDLSEKSGQEVLVKIIMPHGEIQALSSINNLNKMELYFTQLFLGETSTDKKIEKMICLDDLDIDCNQYVMDSELLKINGEDGEENNKIKKEKNLIEVREVLYSNLLKSNCLVTHQPDFASVFISYVGKKINHEQLLRYIVSFRNHNEFHEPCVERIFMDLTRYYQPKQLTVYARYTRRGGLDINPFRSTESTMSEAVERMGNVSWFRQ